MQAGKKYESSVDTKLIIEGGRKISGEIDLQGAKNSSLPILAASLLCNGESVLTNCPDLTDIYAACQILSHLGCKCLMQGNTVHVKSCTDCVTEIPDDLMRKMRSSIVFLGAVLGKNKKCELSHPGGCELGPRPIDMHLSALRKMGTVIKEEHGILACSAPKGLHGANITLNFPSVGATENIILAAVLANGETVIKNAAREPEVTDMCMYLNKCGAKIKYTSDSTIAVKGVEKLNGCEYRIMPDRIAAATYFAAAAVTGGEISVRDIHYPDIDSFITVFEQMGCHVYTYSDRIYLNAFHPLKAVKTIKTMPFPGFPTDAQAVIMAALCKAKGTSIFEENIFENRYRHVDELLRMGADIKVVGKAAIIDGVEKLYGAKVTSTDLRGGAALVVAALGAEGETEVSEVRHIDRGYDSIETVLSSLGAKIRRE